MVSWKITLVIMLLSAFSKSSCFLMRTGVLVPRSLYHASTQRLSANEIISSTANDRIKFVKSLQLKKNRNEHGLVVLEGFKFVSDALSHKLQPKEIFLSTSATSSAQYQYLEQILHERQIPEEKIIRITDKVYNSIAETENGQGVLAVFPKPVYSTGSPLSLQYNPKETKGLLILLLDRISDPGNMGTIIRTAYGLGVNAILNVDGCDVWSSKVLRSSTGLGLNFPIVECSWDELDSIEKQLQFYQSQYESVQHQKQSSSSPLSSSKEFWQALLADGNQKSSEDYYSSYSNSSSSSGIDYTKPTVLVIGSESQGIHLSAHLLSAGRMKQKKIKIPMIRSLDSFNVGVAASIILAEAAKSRLVR
jgi:TrmH family RNA methyltransferase